MQHPLYSNNDKCNASEDKVGRKKAGLSMSTPQQTPTPPTPSRQLSKFLQPGWRERDRERPRSSGTGAATADTTTTTSTPKMMARKTSKLFYRSKDHNDTPSTPNGTTVSSLSTDNTAINDPPVIIEPPSNSKPRSRPPRSSNASDTAHYNLPGAATSSSAPSAAGALGAGGGSVGRNLGDLSSRLSGWFNQTFSGSSTDLSLSASLAQSNPSPGHHASSSMPSTNNENNARGGNSGYSSSTPGRKIALPLAMVAKQGKDHLDKAMRYLLDSDAQPDKSTDKIWLLGVEHPGYEPPPPPSSAPGNILPSSPPSTNLTVRRIHRRDSTESRNKSPSAFRNPLPVSHSNSSTQSLSSAVSSSSTLNPSASGKEKNGLSWPPDFYSDYTSRIWLTYRNTFPPIRDISLSSLEPPISCSPSGASLTAPTDGAPLPSPTKPRWPWSSEKQWTSDTGWGCMLRTGQSLLANSLVHLHLSRQWRRPTQPSLSPDYTTYVKILTWFLDTPSPLSPFGVHRMALAGKELGKDVGSWFGPSTAAGAIKRLVAEWDCGLEVVVGSDGVIYASEVYAASNVKRGEGGGTTGLKTSGSGKHGKKQPLKWGGRPVLVVLGIRLGIDGVNPIYYNSVKALFTFPQSVGIAGGRPSSSYYFVGSQGDSLYYLDPHHTRPAVPLRTPPANLADMSFDEASFLGHEDTGSAIGSSAASQTSSRLGRRRGSEIFMQQGQSHVSTPDTSESERKGSKRLSIRRASLNRMSNSYHHQQASQQIPISPSSANSHGNIPLSSSPLARSSLSTPPQASMSPPRARSSTALASGNGGAPPSPGINGFPQSPASPISASSSASVTPMAMPNSSPSTARTADSQTPLSPSASTATIDPMSAYLATAYSMSELRTFHCERVRKMPISGLDPSMLLGFLCKDEADWKDFRERVADMAKTKKAIFSIQDEPPTWPDDENELLDLESASEDMEDEEDEIESPLGGEEDDEDGEDGIEVKRRQTIDAKKENAPEPPPKNDAPELKEDTQRKSEDTEQKDEDEDSDEEEEDEEDGEFNAVTPVVSSSKFVQGRHDTIVGRARPEVQAAAAAVSKTSSSKPTTSASTAAPKASSSSSVAHDRTASQSTTTTSTSQSHDRKDSHGHDGDNDEGLDEEDDLDDDDEWVDPVAPKSPAALPSGSRHTKVISVSSDGSTSASPSAVAYANSLDHVERTRGKGDDASPTPTATPAPGRSSPSQYGSSMVSHHQKTRSMTRELPSIPTTVVSMSREPRARDSSGGHSRDSSTRSSRRVSQIALTDTPVPFPTRTSEHRKASSASSRSATSVSAGSTPTSPGSSPVSQYPSQGHTHSSHSSQSHSSHANSHAHHRQQHSSAERDATSYPFPGSTTDESGTTSSDSGPSSDAWAGDEKVGSGTRGSLVPKRERRTTVGRTAPSPSPAAGVQQVKAKHGGRTTSGGVRAVWKDEDGDDF